MFKKMTKEIIIMLLLLLAIILVLGVFLYDDIPTSKIVPKVEPYEVPENIKKELEENIDEEKGQTIVTYQIDDTDLNLYEKGKDYEKGKANPFETTGQVNNTTTGNTAGANNNVNNTNNTTGNTTTGNTTNPNAIGNYLPSTGTK